MLQYSSDGIVFRTIKYGETSLICDILTRAKGLRSFIVSGVRKSKSSGNSVLYKPLNLVNIVAYDKDVEKLARIKEISLTHHFQTINVDVVISSVAMFMLEVVRNALKEREPNPELFDFIRSWFIFLDDKEKFNPNSHLVFMYELSRYMGFEPLDNYGQEKPYFDMLEGSFSNIGTGSDYFMNAEESRGFYDICRSSMNKMDQLRLNKLTRNNLTDLWIKYYSMHVPGFKEVYSLQVLRSIMKE